MSKVQATRVNYRKQSRLLELAFADGVEGSLSAEFLRVHSPSAEVKGHGPGQEVLQVGKAEVAISDLKPMGHYALQLVFDDGHDSGLYTWDYLHQLVSNEANLWEHYLARLEAAGESRDPHTQVVQFSP